MSDKLKTRVIAIRDANKEVINIYGYGEYVGREKCPYLGDIENPKIVLDVDDNINSGQTVWGCECWWGELDKFEREMKGDRKIVFVPLEEEEDE